MKKDEIESDSFFISSWRYRMYVTENSYISKLVIYIISIQQNKILGIILNQRYDFEEDEKYPRLEYFYGGPIKETVYINRKNMEFRKLSPCKEKKIGKIVTSMKTHPRDIRIFQGFCLWNKEDFEKLVKNGDFVQFQNFGHKCEDKGFVQSQNLEHKWKKRDIIFSKRPNRLWKRMRKKVCSKTFSSSLLFSKFENLN